MKQLDRKDVPAVSGGRQAPNPLDGEVVPPAMVIPEYPPSPAVGIDPLTTNAR